jgi:hypothetical protein
MVSTGSCDSWTEPTLNQRPAIRSMAPAGMPWPWVIIFSASALALKYTMPSQKTVSIFAPCSPMVPRPDVPVTHMWSCPL